MFSVFAISFKMVDEPGTDSAIWVEVDGKKRYCYGPKDVTCVPDRTAPEQTTIDGVNQAMVALEQQLNAGAGTRKRGLNGTISHRAAIKGIPVLAGMVMAAS